MQIMEITKVVEFDAGHRIPSHKSKCRHLHGHRYRLECTLRGSIKPIRGESDDGMVVDFSDIKQLMTEEVHDKFDHRFIVYEDDPLLKMLQSESASDLSLVVVDFVPTAENLANWIYQTLDKVFYKLYNGKLRLAKVRLFETPNSWADAIIVE